MATLNYSKKQLKPIIEKYSIDTENDVNFASIIQLFDGQTNYHIWALKCFYTKVLNMEHLRNIKDFITSYSSLICKLTRSNIVSYTTKEDMELLFEEMNGIVKISTAKRIIEEFNTAQRGLLTAWLQNGTTELTPLYAERSTEFNSRYKVLCDFNALDDTRKHKVHVSGSALTSITDLVQLIADSLKDTYIWNKESLENFIQNNKNCQGVEKVYDKDNIVILQIPNFAASQALCGNGRTTWCLSREESYFKQYVGNTSRLQYFYFDFNKKEQHELAHIGFTVDTNSGICNAHSTNNQDMMGNGVRFNSKNVNIFEALKMANIDQKVYLRLKALTHYKWTETDIKKYIKKNDAFLAVCVEINGMIVVKILSREGFDAIAHHTLINGSNYNYDGANSNIYAIINPNVEKDSDNALYLLSYSKDKYGLLTLNEIRNPYNHRIDNAKFFDTLNIKEKDFVNKEKVKPEIMLHKLLSEKKEKEVLELLASEKDLDVNFVFQNESPIFIAQQNYLFKAFKALISSAKFDDNILDAMGETLLTSMLYEYRCLLANNGGENNIANVKKMIDTILECDNFDFNKVNFNLDSPINVAVEKESTLWVLENLVARPSVNVNMVNDVDWTCLGNAIRFGNKAALKVLGKRADLVVRPQDEELAKSNGINLKEYIKPQPIEETTVEVSTARVKSKMQHWFSTSVSK